jgi:hypothetical protein
MTRLEDPTTPSSMETALAFLREHGSSNPSLNSIFQKWMEEDKQIEFEDYVRTQPLP